MANSLSTISQNITRIQNFSNRVDSIEELGSIQLPESKVIPFGRYWGSAHLEARQRFVEEELDVSIPNIKGQIDLPPAESLRGTIEQQLGWVQIPLGIAGPIHVKGSAFDEEVCLPLATSEGALVASIDRGARALTLAGGVRSICMASGIQRAPAFLFDNIDESLHFVSWIADHKPAFEYSIRSVSRHTLLQEIRPNIDGNLVTLIMEFTTGDAAGQNMVTICSDVICRYILEHCAIQPKRWFIDGNLSGDKRATTISMQRVRGHKVVAEAVLSAEILHKVLGTDQERMMDYWKLAVINGIHTGAIGVHGHFANALAALFCACGQDIACVAEAAVGVTRFEERPEGTLYISVTLPCLVVGTVGGGTKLPAAQECLKILGCLGEGKVTRFAEICVAAVLAGEASIIAAISCGDFSRAHALFGRKAR